MGKPNTNTEPDVEPDKSSKSGSRRSSSMNSSNASRAKAKAEAARAKMQFWEQEREIKQQTALLKIDLEMLEQKKDLASKEAEANAYEIVDEWRLESSKARSFQDDPLVNLDSSKPPSFQDDPKKFDDDPSKYALWKASFCRITEEVKLQSREQIDLIINYLGPESAKQAISIRAANVYNPERGMHRIWERLDERYGSPELIESTPQNKISNFPSVGGKDFKRLYELSDLITEIEAYMENPLYKTIFSYFNTSTGVNQLVLKLPQHVQRQWVERASRYKLERNVIFPPFGYFVSFVQEVCRVLNDPSFAFESQPTTEKKSKSPSRGYISTKKTDVQNSSTDVNNCPLHAGSHHSLNECREFQKTPISDRKKFLREKGMCYKCCESTTHIAKDCKFDTKCTKCNANHATALHFQYKGQPEMRSERSTPHGGEFGQQPSVKCTEVCGEGFSGRSCAKTLLVNVYPDGKPEKAIPVYAIIDDQSNQSLATSDLLDSLGVDGKEVHYQLASCSGSFHSRGRRVNALCVESRDKAYQVQLQTVFECNSIPQDHSEIATPETAIRFKHLRQIADFIPPLATDTRICLLLGRDVIDVHQVKEQITGPKGSPFALRLGLGWVVIGDVCLGKAHKPRNDSSGYKITTFKTSLMNQYRGTLFEPCKANLVIKQHEPSSESDSLFNRTKLDEKVGLSIEDNQFLKIMDREVAKTKDGHWIAPLPFREPKQRLPNNRQMALKRALILDNNLKKNPTKREHFVNFMAKVVSSGAAEEAPPLVENQEVWYLPIFGVYHPHKPDQIRGVFDSSASYRDLSLNGTLLTGPNLTNSLLGILLRFRKNHFAIAADIEQMFYSFKVKESHRDYLRFLWYRDNNPDLDLVEYRMTAHVFGNSPSPAVASYCLRKCVEKVEPWNEDVKEFVDKSFYVDDGITSTPTEAEAVSLLQRTQSILKSEGKIKLHKIVSNSSKVMNSFPEEDLCKEVKTLKLGEDPLPSLRSLGMWWDLEQDGFRFDFLLQHESNTRRGLLSTLNSIFDPIGFIAPMTLKGKLLMREITNNVGWDEKLDTEQVDKWKLWLDTLDSLKTLSIPRMFTGHSLDSQCEHELHIFSDASEKGVSAVAYMKTKDKRDKVDTGFVMGKCKVAPVHGHTIPRLELCAAVLATQMGETILENLEVPVKTINYYTDSKVVLGYLNNKTRRFYNYVTNRVQQILFVSRPEQWYYIPTDANPADCGTRGLCSTAQLKDNWLTAPSRILRKGENSVNEKFPLICPEEDKEVRIQVSKSDIHYSLIDRFERFSDWDRLVTAVTVLKAAIGRYKCRKTGLEPQSKLEIRKAAERFIVREEQRFAYTDEVNCLRDDKVLPKNSSVASLNPYIDNCDILRIGGRLKQSCLPIEETNPVILPRKCHTALLITRHYHKVVKHQGRLFTETAIRSQGYWIVGAKRLVCSVIHGCIKCRRLRGSLSHQIMADLPEDRLTPGPPFTSVGVDAFGPWLIVTRKTRGGAACSKRWAIMFTCLTTRSVHIEVIEEMSTSSFINALRRFIAIRGDVKLIRSDRGTNFVGTANALELNIINVEDGPVSKYLYNKDITWQFNSPHSSHMGGVWERMIGIMRRILDGILIESNIKNLTHEVLVTFFAEVSAIINCDQWDLCRRTRWTQ